MDEDIDLYCQQNPLPVLAKTDPPCSAVSALAELLVYVFCAQEWSNGVDKDVREDRDVGADQHSSDVRADIWRENSLSSRQRPLARALFLTPGSRPRPVR